VIEEEVDLSTQAIPTIVEAQEILGKAMDEARAGESKELAQLVRDKGDRFVRILSGTISLSRIHDLKNRAFDRPVAELRSSLVAMNDLLGPVTVIMVEDQIYVNDIRIRFGLGSNAGEILGKLWARHNVGGIMFHSPLTEPQIRLLVKHVSGEEAPEGARTHLQDKLNNAGLTMVELQPMYRFREQWERGTRIGADARKAYQMSSGAVGSVWDDLAAGRALNPLPVRKAMSELADMDAASQAKGIAENAKDVKRPAMIRHCVQVATLALMTGRELGLSEAVLSDLGVTASFHDAGYGVDEHGFPPPFERHGTAGVRLMLKQRGFHEARIRRMLACLHHHLPYSHYPRPGLFARIIKIADDYDTLTRYRSTGPFETPPYALARMYAASGTLYDPDLLQLFINRVGQFPPGSILEMGGGSWVTVISGARTPETWAKPLCVMVRTREGKTPSFELEIDLAKGGEITAVLSASDLYGTDL
jgi:HD-GYP domain-containing protein (c-di-GMP phosphodiesterase class II)